MIKKIESFGPFSILAKSTDYIGGEDITTICLYNGSDMIDSECYYHVTDYKNAARDFMRRKHDAYLLSDITAACKIIRTNGTDYEAEFIDYKGEKTIFYLRRYTEDSRYYKQYFEKPIKWMA